MCADYGSDPTVLRWMEGRTEPPKYIETARLSEGGPVVGTFWNRCKSEKRCERLPYAWLLTNTVLRED